MAYAPPSPPFIKARHHGGRQNLRPCKRIVIHGTTGARSCRPGYARIIARYFQTTDRDASAQYVVDPAEVVQCVGDHTVAYGAPPNEDVIHVELCDPVEGPLSRWNGKNHRAMLRRAARLVAELCLAYDVPVTRRYVTGLKLGRRGICGHVDVSKAWGQTSHWDPGAFPWRRFMRLVRAEVKAIKAAAEPIVPEPKKPTRVSKARELIDDALDLLEAVPAKRKHVHDVADDIDGHAARLPKR